MDRWVVPQVTHGKNENQFRHPEVAFTAHLLKSPWALLAGFGLHLNGCMGVGPLLAGRNDAHRFPVVSELFAAIETDDVRACRRCSV